MKDPQKKRYIYLMLAGFGAISLSILLFFALYRLRGAVGFSSRESGFLTVSGGGTPELA